VFVDVANILNRTHRRNASYFVDRAGRVFETTESLMPIVPSGGRPETTPGNRRR
jgi:hypothetical protein